MKVKAALVALFVAGLVASVALAGPAPGKGKPPGKGHESTSASSSTTTTGPTTTTMASGKKVQVCHRSRGKKKPRYRLITISKKALPAHLQHGDVLPVNGQCPGSTSTTTTTVPTSTTTPTSTSTSSTTG